MWILDDDGGRQLGDVIAVIGVDLQYSCGSSLQVASPDTLSRFRCEEGPRWRSLEPSLRAHRTIQNAQLPPMWRRALLPTAVVATYLVLGLVAYWPVLPGISNRLFGQGTDYVLSAWFIGWVPHAIAHGLNPFFTNAMFVPTGVNLAQNTASPLLGLLGAPLTEAFSPLVTTNVLMVLAMPVSATAAFVVLRKWKVWLPGAALGGLVYGFSPYMVGQGADHLVFTFVPIPPFIALTIVSILQRKGSPWRLGLQLGLLVVAQYLICARGACRRGHPHVRRSRVRRPSLIRAESKRWVVRWSGLP